MEKQLLNAFGKVRRRRRRKRSLDIDMDFDLDLDLGNLTRALTGRDGGMPGPGSVLTSRDLVDAIDSEREGSGEDVISDDVRFKHFLAIFYDVFFFLKKKVFYFRGTRTALRAAAQRMLLEKGGKMSLKEVGALQTIL